MKNERNYGLDLYRLLAMLMITMLHINFFYLNLTGGIHGRNVNDQCVLLAQLY